MSAADGGGDAAGRVCLIIRRQKTSIFLSDLSESDDVDKVKQIVSGIVKVPVCDMKLYILSGQSGSPTGELRDEKTLADQDITEANAKPEAPVFLGLCYRTPHGFDEIDIASLSEAAQLPDVMGNVSQFG